MYILYGKHEFAYFADEILNHVCCLYSVRDVMFCHIQWHK